MKAVQEKKKLPARTLQRFTNAQKVEVLKLTKKLLGAKGQRWIQGGWFAVGDDGTGHSTGDVDPEEATSWCLLGAMEEAAYRLGYSRNREESRRFGGMTSVEALAREKNFSSVDSFNDDLRTSWEDVKNLIDERLTQLEGKKKK